MIVRDDVMLKFLNALKRPNILYKFWQFILALRRWEYGNKKDSISIYSYVDSLSLSLYKDTFRKVIDLLCEKISFGQLRKKIIPLLPVEMVELRDNEAEEILVRIVENIRDFYIGKVILRVAEVYTNILTQESLKINQVNQDIKFLNWLNMYDIEDMETTFNPLDERSILLVEEMLKEEHRKIQSPFPSILPYFENGRMYMFAGGAKAGKSFLMTNLADYFAFRLQMPVLYFSIENKTTETLTRLISAHYDMPIEKAHLRFHDWLTELKEKNSYIIIERGLGMTADDVLYYYKKYDERKPEVIIIDYLDLLEGGSNDNMFEKYAEISRRLFKISQQTKTIMLVPTQLNREGVKKMLSNNNEVESLQTTNISRSWGKVEPADAIFLLSRSKEYQDTVLLKLDMCRYSVTPKHLYVPVDFSKSKYYFEKGLFGVNNNSDLRMYDDEVIDKNTEEVVDLDLIE